MLGRLATAGSSRTISSAATTLAVKASPALTNTQNLAADFDQLTLPQLKDIIGGYNHILPSVYAQPAATRAVKDKVLGKLFWNSCYIDREIFIDAILRPAKKGPRKTPALAISDKPKDEKDKILAPMLWLRDRDIHTYCKQKAIHAMSYGRPLVVDCGYEHLMRNRERDSYLRQIFELIKRNTHATEPFSLHLCNVSETSLITQSTEYGNIARQMVTTSSQCFTHTFNRQELILLSPDAPLYMQVYDPNKVYVIGGLVDLANADPVTYKKAQALGVETRKFPIDIWLNWQSGKSKRLTLPSVYKVIERLAKDGDWASALKTALPPRYHQRVQ